MTKIGFWIGAALSLVACGGGDDASGVGGNGGAGNGGSSVSSGAGASTTSSGSGNSGGAGGGTQDCTAGFGGPPTDPNPPIAGSWTLTYQADFLDPWVDDSKLKMGQHWAGFNGVSANSSQNISTECGYLTFKAEKKTTKFLGQDYPYASAEMTSFKRFRQKYGYFEARIKYDAIRGLWPAFWLMPDRAQYGSVDSNRMAYLKFDLANAGAATVTSAKLDLHVTSADPDDQNVALLRAEDQWSEGSINWNNRPKVDPLWIDLTFPTNWSAGTTVTFDVTDYVNHELAGDKVASFALADGFMRARHVGFGSKEGPAASRPRLVLTGPDATLEVSEDASVGEGANAGTNMGADASLDVNESWGDGSSTYDGGMEMDIMEALGHWGDNVTSHAFHWDGYGADHKTNGSGRVQLTPTSDGFHVCGINWQPGIVQLFVDGMKTFEWADPRVGSVEAYLLLSLQMGGWADDLGDGTTPDDAALPGNMIIDYVRVWSGSPN